MSLNLIEASAGTGKTWTIAQRYAQWIREGQTPDRILVVTFTEPATAELRDRIRKRLVEDGLADTAHQMDDASVHTIHGWALSVLRRHAMRTGVPFNSVVDNDDAPLWRQAAYDWFRTFLYPEDGRAPGWRTFLLDTVGTPHKLMNAARKAHPATAGPLDEDACAGYFDELQAARSQLAALGDAVIDEAIEALRTARDDDVFTKAYTESLGKLLDASATALKHWIAHGRPAVPDRNLVSRLSSTKMRASCRKARSEECPSHPLFELLSALPDRPAALDGKAVAAAAHAWVGARYEMMKARRAQIGFDDILRRLRAALDTDPGLAAHLAAEHPRALVDEFQDTDRLQWEIFKRIYAASDDASLTLIGDPKQSIYAFRGAELDTYLAATRAVQGEPGRLSGNWRSSARLVNAINHVFTHCAGFDQGPFLRGEEIAYHPVEAKLPYGELTCGDQAVAPLTVLYDDGDHWRDEAYSRLAAAFAALIARSIGDGDERLRFVDKDGVTHAAAAEHVAVLVSTRVEAAMMRRALAACGLPSVYLSERDSIFATGEATDLLLLLEAALEPRDLSRMRALTACALLAHDLGELERLRTDDSVLDAFVDHIAALGTLWREVGVLAMVHRFASGFGLRTRHGADAERVLTNLLHLGELLEHEAAQLDGEHALVGWLEQQVGDASDAAQDGPDVLRLESDSRIITIVTVHKSKGLQYPLVYIPFAGVGPQRMDSADLEENQRKFYVAITRAQYGCWLGVVPTKSGKRSVSVTHHGLLGYALAGGEEIGPGALGERLVALRGDCTDIALVPLPPPGGVVATPITPPSLPGTSKVYTGEPRQPWWVGSFTHLTRELEQARDLTPPDDAGDGAADKALDEADEDALVAGVPAAGTIHALRRHADTGTFLHGLLEWSAQAGFERVASDDALRRAEVARRARFRFEQSSVVDTVSEWLGHMLVAPLDVGVERPVRHTELERFQPELEFWLAARSVSARRIDDLLHEHVLPGRPRPQLGANTLTGMLKGFIDLVFEHEGRWYVSDYKSNYLGADERAYTDEAMAAQMLKKRYDVQAVLYALALHRQLRARLPGYDFDRHFGGAAYIFLRASAVYRLALPRALIEEMDEVFDGA